MMSDSNDTQHPTFKRIPDSELLHIAVDTETLARGEFAGITEIALMDIRNGTTFSWNIEPSSFHPSLRVDQKTADWHQKRNPGYLEVLEARGISWSDAIAGFVDQLNNLSKGAGKELCIWCQGTDFDIPVLTSNLFLRKEKTPWEYYNVRDIRTLAALYPEIKYQKGHHTALSDVTFAVAHLRKIALADPRVSKMLGLES